MTAKAIHAILTLQCVFSAVPDPASFKLRNSQPQGWDYNLECPSDCAGTPSNKCGPRYWGQVANYSTDEPNLCNSDSQSPINIVTSAMDAANSVLNSLMALLTSYIGGGGPGTSSQPTPALVFNNPVGGGCNGWTQYVDDHSYTISFVEGNDTRYLCNKLTVNYLQSLYILTRIEFHTPSEHTIDGNTYDAEIQFYHESFDHQTLVISTLVNAKTSKFRYITQYQLQVLYQAAATKVRGIGYNTPRASDIVYELQIKNPFVINFYKSFLPVSRSFYAYDGSFTTPPCTEGVRWVLMKDSVDISIDELILLRKALTLYPNTLIDVNGDNRRPVQPLNGRTISRYI